MATQKTGDVQFYNRLFRANSDADGTSYIVHTDQVEGGYFVCATKPTSGTWQTGQLCYCTGDNKFYQYNGTSWMPKEFLELKNGTKSDGTSKASLEYDDTLQAIKFIFN
jgi:hypothetical protein